MDFIKRVGVANLISSFRVALGFVVVALVGFLPDVVAAYWWAFGLTIAVIWLDGLDGYVARKLGEASKLGALVDIWGDRIVEMTYWIAFATWQWVPIWVPIVVMSRGILVDGLRAVAQEQGFTAFGAQSMMQSKIGILLVSSRFSRWTYAVAKAIAFALMILVKLPDASFISLFSLAMACVYITVVFCVLRGLPVVAEAKRLI